MHADVKDQVPLPSRVRERLAAAIVAVALGVTSFVFATRAFWGASTSGPTVKPASPTIANGLLVFSGSPPGIYTTSPDGTGVANLTGRYSGDVVVAAYWPRWSPDGTRIAFSGYSAGGVDDDNGGANYDIHVMNADGTGIRNLTTSPEDIATQFSQVDPTWSPDGTKIAYDGDDGLYVMNADGSNQTKIADGQDASWSPDGTRIAFERVQGESSDLFTVHPDGTGLTQLTNGPGYDGWAAWSPDGTKIAFAHYQGDQGAIHVTNADGTGLTSVFDQPGVDAGRPVLRFLRNVHLRLTSSRCQRSSVSGFTTKEDHSLRGIARLAAASSARSKRLSRGRFTCRRNTFSWWRNTRISMSRLSSERVPFPTRRRTIR